MLINLQGNVGTSINMPILNNFDDVIFCNTGGKPTMNLTHKNIPPMDHLDIPTEILIKDRKTENDFSRIQSYSKQCLLNLACMDEIPPFRFQVVYDGYEFLYYPEFKLYERPYLLLEFNLSAGSNTIVFNKNSVNDDKNLTYLEIGNVILFKDYGTTYKIISTVDYGSNIEVMLERNLDENYLRHDLIVFPELKYELQTHSNILNDGTTNTYSPFKIKFIDTFDAKNYNFTANMGKSDNFTLVNDVFDDFVDLLGDDKITSISKNVEIEADVTITLDHGLNMADINVKFSSSITGLLDLHSFFTIKSSYGLEIVKVIELVNATTVKVERGQMYTTALDHDSATALLYFPIFIYFVMLPYNKELTERYVAYRNIDFVLTWV